MESHYKDFIDRQFLRLYGRVSIPMCTVNSEYLKMTKGLYFAVNHTQKIEVIINMGHRRAVATIKNHKKAGKFKNIFLKYV